MRHIGKGYRLRERRVDLHSKKLCDVGTQTAITSGSRVTKGWLAEQSILNPWFCSNKQCVGESRLLHFPLGPIYSVKEKHNMHTFPGPHWVTAWTASHAASERIIVVKHTTEWLASKIMSSKLWKGVSLERR